MGIAVLAIIILAFAAGAARHELALTLGGAVFLLPWVYCLVMSPLLALLHSRRASRACIRISQREIAAGETVEVSAFYKTGCFEAEMPQSNDSLHSSRRILQLPGILVRCRLLLATNDGRWIREDFKPTAPHSFTVAKRGAYFSAGNEFVIFDSLGFFRFVFRVKEAENGARLLASPGAADEPMAVNARAGDSKLQPEFSLQRTDDLTDHRPYIPGDDPRRINWKLYSHGGGLFVREGENEPPPHSNILIFIDCEYDPVLYGIREARRGIDLLCENALAVAAACKEAGMDVQVAYSQEETGRSALAFVMHKGYSQPYIPVPEKMSGVFSLPAAFAPPTAPLAVPLAAVEIPVGRGIVVFALPRSHLGGTSAILDNFLNKASHLPTGNSPSRQTDMFFLYGRKIEKNDATHKLRKDNGILSTTAEACAALYSRRPGVRAKAVEV
jgi:uncharacterized protein (DUF58 family)